MPTIAETEDRCGASAGSKYTWCAYSAAALASLLYSTGSAIRRSSAPRTSNPRQASLAKFVAPRAAITPSALTGPGVSRPTARTRARGVPVISSTCSSDRASASIAFSGPSFT